MSSTQIVDLNKKGEVKADPLLLSPVPAKLLQFHSCKAGGPLTTSPAILEYIEVVDRLQEPKKSSEPTCRNDDCIVSTDHARFCKS